MGVPDFDFLFGMSGVADCGALGYVYSGASNIVHGTNPPFYLTDFFLFAPKFGGVPKLPTAGLTANSPTVTVDDATDLAAGQFVTDTANPQNSLIPPGTTIQSISGTTLTLSANALATISGVTITAYPSPLVPLSVLTLYAKLASSSLNKARWLESWDLGMRLYIAHFSTLYLRAESDTAAAFQQAGPQGSGLSKSQLAARAAASGIARGFVVSEGVGPLSTSYAPNTTGFEGWGELQETDYGKQLIRHAKIVGFGLMYIW